MQLKHIVWVLCSLSIAALGQSSAQSPTSQPLHGIKVFSSSFDSTTQIAKLDFINDSPSDITAWGYCMNTTNRPGDTVEHGGCSWVDTIPVVIDRQVLEQTTSKPINADCPDCHVLHPGEHKILSVDFSSVPVITAEIVIRLIVYANGRIESVGNDGLGMQQHIASQRQNALKLHQSLADMGADILADKSDQHPAVTMIEALQRAHPEWTQVLHHFKSPEWRKANDTEFIPKDERSYLQNFVAEQKMQAAEFSKHQIGGKPMKRVLLSFLLFSVYLLPTSAIAQTSFECSSKNTNPVVIDISQGDGKEHQFGIPNGHAGTTATTAGSAQFGMTVLNQSDKSPTVFNQINPITISCPAETLFSKEIKDHEEL